MINGAHHISLSTADMDRFLHFYRDLLGLPQTSDAWIEPGAILFETIVGHKDARVRTCRLLIGNLEMEIFQYVNPTPRPGEALRPCDVGIRHIAFDVTDIEGECARLKAAGVDTFFSEPQHMTEYGMKSVYLRDPDGNIVELQEILPGSPFGKSHIVGIPQVPR